MYSKGQMLHHVHYSNSCPQGLAEGLGILVGPKLNHLDSIITL
jgi:hypothetical protein